MLKHPFIRHFAPFVILSIIGVGVTTAAVVGLSSSTEVSLNTTGTFRTTDLVVDNTSKFGGLANFGPTSGRGWYINGNELNQGFNFAALDTGYINYSGHAGGTSQFRDLWVGNGKNGATPIFFVQSAVNRVGINTLSPAQALDVVGAAVISGQTNLAGGAVSAAGTVQWGPLGGNGGMSINPTTGSAFFQPFTSTANPWGFGFGVTGPISMIDIAAETFAPGTANPRTDTNPTIMNGVAVSQFDTTAGDITATGMFFDSSYTKVAGANDLYDVLLRLDANGPNAGGGVTSATALWIDKGEFRNSGHTMYAVRPSTGGGPTAPPAISGCGAAPAGSATGNDNGGRITIGGGSPTACTLSFQLAWTDHTNTSTIPACLVQSPDGTIVSYTTTASQLVIGWSGTPTELVYHCFGMDDNIPGP